MSYPANSVANYLIDKAFATGESVSPMKVIKLVYLSHGWHLAFQNAPLIGEAVEAWKYGPVIPSLYHGLKRYGTDKVTAKIMDWDNSALCEVAIPEVPKTDTFACELLDVVYKSYGKLSALQLSTMTHQQGTPWWVTWWERNGKDQRGAIIPNDLISEFFQRKRTAGAGSANAGA